jgi:hypothetical protein
MVSQLYGVPHLAFLHASYLGCYMHLAAQENSIWRFTLPNSHFGKDKRELIQDAKRLFSMVFIPSTAIISTTNLTRLIAFLSNPTLQMQKVAYYIFFPSNIFESFTTSYMISHSFFEPGWSGILLLINRYPPMMKEKGVLSMFIFSKEWRFS